MLTSAGAPRRVFSLGSTREGNDIKKIDGPIDIAFSKGPSYQNPSPRQTLGGERLRTFAVPFNYFPS